MTDRDKVLWEAINRIEKYNRDNPTDPLNATGALILIKELLDNK